MKRLDAAIIGTIAGATAAGLTSLLALPPAIASLAGVLCGWAGCITLKWLREAK